jgi:hypothetical protein
MRTAKSGLDVTFAHTSFTDSFVSNNAIAATRQMITKIKETATANEECKMNNPFQHSTSEYKSMTDYPGISPSVELHFTKFA